MPVLLSCRAPRSALPPLPSRCLLLLWDSPFGACLLIYPHCLTPHALAVGKDGYPFLPISLDMSIRRVLHNFFFDRKNNIKAVGAGIRDIAA